ncbi:TRAP-type C4-dicarboxylate transport system, small permease component [Gracilibacillus ureilyticus]|uniref:TRAP-type C4-dicarboxylate transport system, small permease component n=1 Tax=Gracilibacillus ureilyticus TaxID=531814 RepID=A0A1H9SWK8_9BACI|nr:TRAP transporter small permease [Gracilibacillus ureilyticus]SER89301.1 TRAP-type C4-dicarboxylate transport system, small permease component [Gracilibacillus ureilyticus]
MKVFRWIDKAIMRLEEFILSFSIILISIMIVGNVIAREIFNSGAFFFAYEVSKFAIVIATFMGIGYAARKGRHISMSAFYDFAPFKVRKVMMIIINFVTAIFMFIMAYYTYSYVMFEYGTGAVTTSLQVPRYLMSVFIPIGFFMAGIQFIRNTLVNFSSKAKDKVYLGIDAVDYNDTKDKEVKLEDLSV